MDVPEVLRSILEIALRDSTLASVDERGNLHLHIEVCLGDRGEYMWDTASLYFTPKRHTKDFGPARELVPHG